MTQKETRGFETEVKQLLQLMIHSLYSNKEIFLRELVSNASDAADKLRFEALHHAHLYENDTELKIWISFDESQKTITIGDNGVGMSYEEVVKNLGTIAHSGTKDFLKTLTGDQAKDANLIGQFGVGFYSGFIVADAITVRTRRAGLPVDQGVEWHSKGDGEYTIEIIEKASRGTEIILHIKEGDEEFLSDHRLRHIIAKYSDHISLPIVMKNEAGEEEVVNRATALWTLPKSEISEEQYQEFYKHIAHDYENALDWAHNRVEGKLEYITLLYIPSRAPFDLWDPNHTRGLKLYVRRVFIMEDAEQLLPRYLRFVRGVIDSHDLPLNVSREILQSSRVVEAIKQGIIKRVLSMLESMAAEKPEKYQTFWKTFGAVLKEGPAEDFANRERIAKLLRFSSTQSATAEPEVSLEAYIARMKPEQQKIYYCAADSYSAAKNSPHLEIFEKKGIEVLLLTDRVDEWLTTHLSDFEGKSFQSVAKGALDLPALEGEEKKAEDSKEEDRNAAFQSTIEKMQTVLGSRVKEIRLTERLTSSPACVVADEHAMSAHMERILKAAGQSVDSKPILELNPEHPFVKQLQQEANQQKFEDLSYVLLDQAILSEGGQLAEPAAFVKRLNTLLLEQL